MHLYFEGLMTLGKISFLSFPLLYFNHSFTVVYRFPDRPSYFQPIQFAFYLYNNHPFMLAMMFYTSLHHLWEFFLTAEQVISNVHFIFVH